jgi:hypothetical protein
MSAANAANAQTVRRPVAPTRPAGAPVARAAMQAAPVAAGFDDHDDEFRLNLSDIPRIQESLDVEGLKPSLLSRLLDLVAPLKP